MHFDNIRKLQIKLYMFNENKSQTRIAYLLKMVKTLFTNKHKTTYQIYYLMMEHCILLLSTCYNTIN